MSASKDPSLMSPNAAAGGQQRARADPSFHRRQESKHVLHCVHRCLLTFVHLYPSDAMLHRADLLCRIGSVCARPAPTSRAQTQASVLPRSCSGRGRRLLARASASLTRGERRSASKVLVPSGGRQPLRWQAPAWTLSRLYRYTASALYRDLYSKKRDV